MPIGWLRIVRPGSIIGPQQQFMKEIEQRMWREGELSRARLSSGISKVNSDDSSEIDSQNKSLTSKISNLSMTEESKEMQGDSLRARRLGVRDDSNNSNNNSSRKRSKDTRYNLNEKKKLSRSDIDDVLCTVIEPVKKCIHSRQRSTCKDCRGSVICEHSRVRSQCKDCGGGNICEHSRKRSQCKDCGGSGICEHSRIRSRCKDCGGSSICEHSRIKYSCKKCKENR